MKFRTYQIILPNRNNHLGPVDEAELSKVENRGAYTSGIEQNDSKQPGNFVRSQFFQSVSPFFNFQCYFQTF